MSSIDLLLDGSLADEFVDQNVLRLADAERPVGGLVLDRRVPTAVEVHHVRGGGQVEPRATRLSDSTKKGIDSSSWNRFTNSWRS